MLIFFRNEKGFSLVQGLVLAGIVAGSSLVATRLLTDQKIAQKGAETRDQVEDLNNLIYTVLQTRLNCKETMIRSNLQLALSASASPATTLTVNQVWTRDAMIAQTNGLYMGNNVQIKAMRLGPQSGGMRNLTIDYERIFTGANANVQLKQGYGSKQIRKTLTMRIQREPATGAFSSCYVLSGGKSTMNATTSTETGNDISRQLCQEMNKSTGQNAFIWDEANSICKPNSQCPADQIYTGIDSLGTAKCRNIEDWMNFNEILDSSPPTCPANSYIGFEVDSTLKVVRLTCTSTATNQCSAQDIYWSDGSNTCTAKVNAASHGTDVFVQDTAAPTTGSATANCSPVGWTMTGNCITTCPAATVAWGLAPCTANVASGIGGSTTSVTDSTAPGVGSGTAFCEFNKGTWHTTGTCN